MAVVGDDDQRVYQCDDCPEGTLVAADELGEHAASVHGGNASFTHAPGADL